MAINPSHRRIRLVDREDICRLRQEARDHLLATMMSRASEEKRTKISDPTGRKGADREGSRRMDPGFEALVPRI